MTLKITNLPISNYMTAYPISVEPNVSFAKVVSFMAERGFGNLVVSDGTIPKGILTEHEILKAIAESRDLKKTSNDWEVIILKFCLDFEDCFKIWTNIEEPDSVKNSKCMTIMNEIAKGRKHFSEIIHLQNIAQTIFTEFHQTYKRIA